MALMARAYNQAQKFGAEMAIPDEVVQPRAASADGAPLRAWPGRTAKRVRARSRRDRQRRPLPPARRRQASMSSKARACITGPRRWRRSYAPGRRWRWSAAAIPPARRWSIWPRKARKVWLMVRGAGPRRPPCRAIWSTASAASPMSKMLPRTEVSALEGEDGVLEAVRWRDGAARARSRRADIRHLFLFIGADPQHRLAGGLRAWRWTTRASC